MTAMVLLDAGADLERTVAYDPKRHYAYKNWMRFTRGDQLRGRDLFLATLTGSQNITARMLVDLTSYTEPQFVERMNIKASSLGLAQTRFVDVHGLGAKNVSTASEVARMFEVALTYPDIRDALSKPEATVTWRTRRGKSQERLFHHTNTLMTRWQRFATEASKTGYLDEAGDTIAMRIRDPRSGRRFTVVTLGESRRYPRFRLAKRLAEQVIGTQRIATSK
jgi:D-alanyl-D-alanine carboxypeptidase